MRNELPVKNYAMFLHMNTAYGHHYSYAGDINLPGHPIDGQKVVVGKFNSKNQAKQKSSWVIKLAVDTEPEFDKLSDFLKHYKIGTQETSEDAKNAGTDAGTLPQAGREAGSEDATAG